MKKVLSLICHGLLMQSALCISSVSGAALRAVKATNEPSAAARMLYYKRNSTEAALDAREALRADMDSRTTSGGDFEAYIQACDRSPESEGAVNRIGLHESEYSKNRKDHQYYRDAWCALRFFGGGARSVVDVGSSVPPFLLSADWIPERELVSKYFPGGERPCGKSTHCMLQDGIEAHIQDFYQWKPQKTYDVAISMQVVEHVWNPSRFMHKLMKTGRTVVVTVPYRWEDDKMKFHKQHKITLDDMRKWAGKKELHFHVSQDQGGGKYSQRLLMVFKGDV